MSDEIHDVLRTQELRLVDKSGRDCAVLSSGEKGSVSLSFLDSANKVRTKIGVGENGQAVFELGHAGGASSFSIVVEQDGRVIIEGIDAEGVERFKLQLTGNGSHTELSFHEKYRKPRMLLMAEDKGPAGLFIMDTDGKALFTTT
ncbi:MAG TPA: hypothetical protein V6D22_01865 [Candidatus Obscuribacterales bacterium]